MGRGGGAWGGSERSSFSEGRAGSRFCLDEAGSGEPCAKVDEEPVEKIDRGCWWGCGDFRLIVEWNGILDHGVPYLGGYWVRSLDFGHGIRH